MGHVQLVPDVGRSRTLGFIKMDRKNPRRVPGSFSIHLGNEFKNEGIKTVDAASPGVFVETPAEASKHAVEAPRTTSPHYPRLTGSLLSLLV